MLRIMTGGSAGFRTIMALPRCGAADGAPGRCAVVSVNSSMLARVPGPADFDEIDDDDLGVRTRTRPATTAATIGTVA